MLGAPINTETRTNNIFGLAETTTGYFVFKNKATTLFHMKNSSVQFPVQFDHVSRLRVQTPTVY